MNDNLVISGKVIRIMDMISGESKRNPGKMWQKQEYVIETYANYPRQVCFGIFGEDKIRNANIQLGEDITIQFEINSREYNGRWYTNIDAINVMHGAGFQAPQADPYAQGNGYQNPSNPYQQQQQMPSTNNNFGGKDNGDDLPF
ncbi:DUF3127 domain-containing protein [Porphyromonadaceae bacterium W3.11]|nr:DUF3127 domain-containing protein [Porphyromonadaceae bacterium W3.11]